MNAMSFARQVMAKGHRQFRFELFLTITTPKP
jgi:hypothetical protein